MLSMQPISTTSNNKQVRRAILVVTLFYGFLAQKCNGTVLNNVFDSQPIYTVFGTDEFYKKRDTREFRFVISPFYQQTSTARDNAGTKVPAGNRLGPWNMFAILYGGGGAQPPLVIPPATYPWVPGTNYPNLRIAQQEIATITSKVINSTTTTPPVEDRYRVGPPSPATPSSPIPVYPGGLANELNFNPDIDTFAYVTVPLDYEKIGVRSQFNFDFKWGLGFSIKAGFVDIKQAPSKFILEPQFNRDVFNPTQTTIPPATTPTAQGPDDAMDAMEIYDALYDTKALKGLTDAKDLNLDLTTYRKTEPEDVHIQIYWHFPINFKDKVGERALTMVPYLAAGVWLPASPELDQNKIYAVPAGNDGYTGFTADASIAFDFPVLPRVEQTLQAAFGGGILLFGEKDKINQRFPTSEFQNGMIPWKIGSLCKRPGLTWYLNLSAKSEEFIEGLSVYFDFIYTKHAGDTIVLKGSNAAFQNGFDTFVRKTSWKNQQVNIGSNYRLCKEISLGGAVQAHISGIRVYRSVTVLGSLTATF